MSETTPADLRRQPVHLIGRQMDQDEFVIVELTRAQLAAQVAIDAAHLGRVKARGGLLDPTEADAIRAVLLAGHHMVTKVDSEGPDGRISGCTTAEAGQRLGLTRWAVRKAIARGDLVSRQAVAGGPYVIDERSIAAFARKRAARTAPSEREVSDGDAGRSGEPPAA